MYSFILSFRTMVTRYLYFNVRASPFDLGDKISIIESASDPPSDCDPGHQVMWIVEDWYVHSIIHLCFA